MYVYVLLESAQISPVAVFRDMDCESVLPQDAVLLMKNPDKSRHMHREIVAEWESESAGCRWRLVHYRVI